MQQHVSLVDLAKSFPTNIYLQNLASIQKRTSPTKFAHLAEDSENGSISNLSTKVVDVGQTAVQSSGPQVPAMRLSWTAIYVGRLLNDATRSKFHQACEDHLEELCYMQNLASSHYASVQKEESGQDAVRVRFALQGQLAGLAQVLSIAARSAAAEPSGPEWKGSIGEGPNHSNYSDRSSVRILCSLENSKIGEISTFSKILAKFR